MLGLCDGEVVWNLAFNLDRNEWGKIDILCKENVFELKNNKIREIINKVNKEMVSHNRKINMSLLES